MAGDKCISVVVKCVEVTSVAISVLFSAEQAEQWEFGYIFPSTELLSFESNVASKDGPFSSFVLGQFHGRAFGCLFAHANCLRCVFHGFQQLQNCIQLGSVT